jgi:hypothetical protein
MLVLPYTAILLMVMSPADPVKLPGTMDPITWQCLKDIAELQELYERNPPSQNQWCSNFNSEARCVWRAWRDAEELPKLVHWTRFPNREYCLECKARAVEWETWYFRRLVVRGYVSPDTITVDTIPYWYWHHVWNAACRTTDPTMALIDRRRAMVEVRAMIGEEAWWTGQMPLWAPNWAFTK